MLRAQRCFSLVGFTRVILIMSLKLKILKHYSESASINVELFAIDLHYLKYHFFK
jgi:hypothetical protein